MIDNSKSLSNTIFASSHDALVLCDINNNVISVNTAFESLTGFAQQNIQNQNFYHFLLNNSELSTQYNNDLLKNQEFAGDLTILDKNDKTINISLTTSSISDENNSSLNYISMLWLSEEKSSAEPYHDLLTGLPNRELFVDRTEQAIIAAPRAKKSVAILMIGLDRFVLVNDGLGFEAGDKVLKAIAKRLDHTIRRSDTAARIQGDRFALVMQITSVEDSVIVAEKILKSLNQSIKIDSNELNITASIGISIFPSDASGSADLIKNAESSMLYTKKLGGNHYQFFSDEMNSKAKQRLEMENKLRRAIQNEEFVVYYQPKVSLETNEIIGAEALVRWLDPEKGLVPPGLFIPIAEETHLINDIGAIVLRDSCLQNSQWIKQGYKKIIISVNVTASQFKEKELISMIKENLQTSGLPSSYLELEITESMLVGDMNQVIEKLTELRSMGIRISIDDFGTGYSSLSYLSRFPVTTLKVDRAFVKDIESDKGTAEITRAIIALSHGLNLEVVAEGAETKEHIDFLRQHGCDLVQGFYYSKPLAASEFEEKLKSGYIYDRD